MHKSQTVGRHPPHCPLVHAQPYTMGYSVWAEAKALGLSMAKLRKGTNDVEANLASVESALYERGTLFHAPAHRLTADIQNTAGSLAWPIAGYTYLVMRKATTHFHDGVTCLPEDASPRYCVGGQDCETRAATVKFWRWFYTSPVSTAIAARNGFASLTGPVRDIVLSRLEQDVTCNGQPVYKAPSTISVQGKGFAAMQASGPP